MRARVANLLNDINTTTRAGYDKESYIYFLLIR